MVTKQARLTALEREAGRLERRIRQLSATSQCRDERTLECAEELTEKKMSQRNCEGSE